MRDQHADAGRRVGQPPGCAHAAVALLLIVAGLLVGCGSGESVDAQLAASSTAQSPSATARVDAEAEQKLADTVDVTLPVERIKALAKPWTGDLDGMLERRVVRVLVVPTQTHYFVHNGQAQGIAAEMLKKDADLKYLETAPKPVFDRDYDLMVSMSVPLNLHLLVSWQLLAVWGGWRWAMLAT